MARASRTVSRSIPTGETAVRAGAAVALVGAAALWTAATGTLATPGDRIAVLGRFVHLLAAATLVGGLAWQHLLVRRSSVTAARERYRRAFDRFDRIAVPAAGGVVASVPLVAAGAPTASGTVALLASSGLLALAVLLLAVGGGDAVARHRGPVGVTALVAGVATVALAATVGSSVGTGSLVAVAATIHVLALSVLVGGLAWVCLSQPGPEFPAPDPGADRRRWWFRSVAPILVLLLAMTAGWQVIGAYIGTVGRPGGASLAATAVNAAPTVGEIWLCLVLFAVFAIGSRVVDRA